MTRTAITFSFLTALGMSAHAVLPVEDYAALAQRAQKSITDAANHALDYAKAVENEFNTYSTRLYTYEQQLNSAEQLLRYGTAANTIGKIPGVSTIARLSSDVQRYRYDFQNIRSFADPQRYQQIVNGIAASYQQPSLSSFTTASGYRIPPSQSDYAFDTQRWGIAKKAYDDLDQMQRRKQEYLQELESVTRMHDGARTDQDARKYGEAMASIHQKIAHLDQQMQQEGVQAQIQRQRIGDEENVVRTNQAHQQEQMQYQAIDTDLSELTPGGFHQGAKWINRP